MDEKLKKQLMINKNNDLKKYFGDQIIYDENLNKYSWFKIGGPTEIFFKPRDVEQLKNFLITAKKMQKAIHVLGVGSNTLYRDGGFKGIAIKLSPNFSFIRVLKDNIIEAGAATIDKKVSDFATENSLAGLEFLSCIPGSIGGAIRMNSGCYGFDVSQILESVTVITFEGKKLEIKKDNINFSYRGCDLKKDLVIISAKFKGEISNKEVIRNYQKQLIEKKKYSQPSKINTCGSTFKNTKNKKAWELIKESKCENISVGNAFISKKHCNFFENKGEATSRDIEELIAKVRSAVFKKTGIKLDLELKIVGEDR